MFFRKPFKGITGNKITINSVQENRPGDVPIFITDARKVRQATKWIPKRNAETTLTEIYSWIHQFKELVNNILL
ncbi:hypothetical protein ACE1CI_35075 [Aerosakkonemataceae cyanobacterium BLCC-F50]|uniref:Uncharacterized protein n=1 Tax=Floridaenema flaviceps BLCC-F50 TaxID=3153642 RepID=A0ABV4Y2E7_9CYAN